MANKRKRRKNSFFKNLILVALLGLSAYFIFSVGNEVLAWKGLRTNISDANAKEQDLQGQKEELIQQKENLENPDYVLRYARGKYLVTKEDGEQVFKLPDEKE